MRAAEMELVMTNVLGKAPGKPSGVGHSQEQKGDGHYDVISVVNTLVSADVCSTSY